SYISDYRFLWNLFSPVTAFMSSRRNQMARPHLSGALPAVKTICSSPRMRSTSSGRISGRAASCLERVRDAPDICDERLSWAPSAVVLRQRREMYPAVSGSLIAANDTHDALSNHLLVASRPP